MNTNKGKLDFEIEHWSKVKYLVVCTWGIHVDERYPNPVISQYYFENWEAMNDFVTDYMTNNWTDTKQIIRILEIAGMLDVETYEVATKVRVVRHKNES